MNFEQARINMVEQQVRPWDVLDPNVLAVMEDIPRENFVPTEHRNLAYTDTGIPLIHDQHMLKPTIVGRLLQALAIQSNEIVLEVGTGTGYTTACLAKLAAHVYSVDIYEEFQTMAQKNLSSVNIDNVTLATGDAAHGWDQRKEYDAIAITGSMPEVPETYKKALTVGGRLFVITGDAPVMDARLITRVTEQSWSDEILFETELQRLVNAEKIAEFVF